MDSGRAPLRVAIIGAGTGGLCLAQGLRRSGIDVRVFERDRTPVDRLQGYRLHVSATGNRALMACLPPTVFDRFAAAAAKPNTAVTFLDEKLHRLLAIPVPRADPARPESEIPISRIALRRILLEGLDDVVAFDKTFRSFEAGADGTVAATFEDGTIAEADVLVGADGAGSRVRRQLLPDASRVDTGLIAVSGRFPIDEAARRETPPPVFAGPTLVPGPRGCFLFASAVEYPRDASTAYDRDEYVMWGFSARRERLSRAEDQDGTATKATVLHEMRDWHPALRRLVERAEPRSMTSFVVRTSEPVPPWTTGPVTLLGDALHNMTPFRGMGANVALRDAAALCDALRSVRQDDRELLPVLATYEQDMVDYGFAAVQASLHEMHRLHETSPIRRFLTRAFLRLAQRVPSLQRSMRGKR